MNTPVMADHDLLVPLGLGLRVKNVLQAAGITSIAELCERREVELRMLPGMGAKSLHEVLIALHLAGYSLREEEQP